MIHIPRSFILLFIVFSTIPISIYGTITAEVEKFNNLTNVSITDASTPDYTLSVTPAETSACAFTSVQINIDIGSIEGFSNPVTLSVTNLPPGATFSFNPTPVTPGNSSILTLDNLEGGAGNTYTITIEANSTTGTKTELVGITIFEEPSAISLTTPANNELDVNLIPTLNWAADPSALNYLIQVATDPGFSNLIVDTDAFTTNYAFSAELEQYTAYFWRVKGVSIDCEGSWSSTRKFTTVPCFSYIDTTTIGIPDENFTTSIITVPEYGTVTDINVTPMYGQHNFISDLIFNVMGPNNVQVELFSNICGGEDDFSLALDDESLTPVTNPSECGSLNSAMTFQPAGNLSDLDGQSIHGDWILIIEDNNQGDVGQLDGWGIRLCPFGFSVLPIELVDFQVVAEDASFRLNWATAMEFNNAGFDIERRSEHETAFSSIGWVEGSGEASQEMIHYHFEDNKVLPGVLYYYRLLQVDFDGEQSYSPVRSGILKERDLAFSVFPNPVTKMLHVNCIDELKENTALKITDATGRTLKTQSMNDCDSNINMNDLPEGVYFLHIDTMTKHWVRKIIKY
jgi:hypothetical protein